MKSLLGFYMISKVHKTPIMNCLIFSTYSSVTSLASLLALRILFLIHENLRECCLIHLLNLFIICLSIDEVFSHIKRAHSCNTSTTSHFYLCNFMVMYSNLNPTWCIDAILKLVTDYSIDSLVEFIIDFSRQQQQDFNPNI
jgi:hypothetical protein